MRLGMRMRVRMRVGGGYVGVGVCVMPPPRPGSGVRPDCRDIVGVVESARQRDGWGLGEGWNIYGYLGRVALEQRRRWVKAVQWGRSPRPTDLFYIFSTPLLKVFFKVF